jgi:hypothetical protein
MRKRIEQRLLTSVSPQRLSFDRKIVQYITMTEEEWSERKRKKIDSRNF